jgi:hypothetical protein
VINQIGKHILGNGRNLTIELVFKVILEYFKTVPAAFCVDPAATQDFQKFRHLFRPVFEIVDYVRQFDWRLALR